MSQITVRIFQGTSQPYPPADINIVIDVIRAFTVSHIAFLRKAREVLLVNTVEEAFALRVLNPQFLLAGEIAGIPIPYFDLDNSPHTFSTATLEDKTLVQKTSNGVKATLLALNAETILVTGLSNACNTAMYARRIAVGKNNCTVNIIASHAGDDDDLACAEYIQDILLDHQQIKVDGIKARILNSRPAQKFFDAVKIEFDVRDMNYCASEIACDFVMQIDKSANIPRIIMKTIYATAQ